MNRTCKNCGHSGPQEDFTRYRRKDPNTGIIRWYYNNWCRPCKNQYVMQRDKERKMGKLPKSFVQCQDEDCNYIWKMVRHCYKCGKEHEL